MTSTPERLTARERQILAAVRELLNIPVPQVDVAPNTWKTYERELCGRAVWLCGYLAESKGADMGRVHAAEMLGTFRKEAARPLPYTPEAGDAAAAVTQ